MIQGTTKNGDLKNILVNEKGALQVEIQGSEEGVEIKQTSDIEVTLDSKIMTLSTEEQTISVGKKVTAIMIANYSESADISITIGNNIYQVGSNLAVELPMNINIDNIVLTSTKDDVKAQLVIKGVE